DRRGAAATMLVFRGERGRRVDTPHDPYGALRFRDYRRVLAGSVLATIATQVQTAALEWELYERTRDPLYNGLIGLVQFVPVLLLVLPAGQVADSFNRKFIVVGAQGLTAIAALGLSLLSYIEGPIPLMYGCLFLTGLGRVFYMPARWALVSQVVPLPLMANA